MTETELEARWQQAEKLSGRPVPGLRMTEAQFVKWRDEDLRTEWIDGKVIMMAPANIDHVDLNFWLVTVTRMFVEHHQLGKVFGIETEIRLPRVRRNPDLLFVSKSRLKIIKPTFIDGPPDLIVEIVSPDSESRDWRDKFSNYESAGVREYWIIDPSSKRVEAYGLGRDKHYKQIDEKQEMIFSKVLRGLYIRPQWLWQSPLPKVAGVLKELGIR
jgi:Uma2 family endonuclease